MYHHLTIELEVREFVKVCAKPDNQPLKQALTQCEDLSTERYISTFVKMKFQLADMCAFPDMVCHTIEPEPYSRIL